MFDRYESGEQAVLVHINFSEESSREDLHELQMLVSSAGVTAVDVITGSRQTPHPRYFVGSGKAEEIANAVRASEAQVVIFNHALSPSQERNLEQLCKCKVIDRTGLILDIFAQRARTHEGKLQVELAQLRHISTRLIRGWTHLERQKGGIGLRGPGETQLETYRRLLRGRIKSILSRLGKVQKQREQGRRARVRAEIPTLSLVGYTNAGKSTLFNTLTTAEVYAADQLFATLDPTLRRFGVENVGEVVLADTVGFIRHLPHKLVEAFQATLQEAADADLLMHVIDAAAPERENNIEQVELVLNEIDANEVLQLRVYNKIDLLEFAQPRIDRDESGRPVAVWVSARENVGLELIPQAIGELLGKDVFNEDIQLTPADARLRAILYELGGVRSEQYAENGDMVLSIQMQRQDFRRALARADVPEHRFIEPVREAWH